MRVLIDTCVFLWLAYQTQHFSRRAREILGDPDNTLFPHQASVWEIQIKYSLGKLRLPHPPRVSIPQAIGQLGLEYRTLDDDTIFALEKLPSLHRDPFDCLPIAHAILEGIPIITPDPLIEPYPLQVIW